MGELKLSTDSIFSACICINGWERRKIWNFKKMIRNVKYSSQLIGLYMRKRLLVIWIIVFNMQNMLKFRVQIFLNIFIFKVLRTLQKIWTYVYIFLYFFRSKKMGEKKNCQHIQFSLPVFLLMAKKEEKYGISRKWLET